MKRILCGLLLAVSLPSWAQEKCPMPQWLKPATPKCDRDLWSEISLEYRNTQGFEGALKAFNHCQYAASSANKAKGFNTDAMGTAKALESAKAQKNAAGADHTMSTTLSTQATSAIDSANACVTHSNTGIKKIGELSDKVQKLVANKEAPKEDTDDCKAERETAKKALDDGQNFLKNLVTKCGTEKDAGDQFKKGSGDAIAEANKRLSDPAACAGGDGKGGGGGMDPSALAGLAQAAQAMMNKKPKEAKKEEFDALATALEGSCDPKAATAGIPVMTAAQCNDNPAFKDKGARLISNNGSCKCMCTGMQGTSYVCEKQSLAGMPGMSGAGGVSSISVAEKTDEVATGDATIPANNDASGSPLRSLSSGGDYGLPSGWGTSDEVEAQPVENVATNAGPTSFSEAVRSLSSGSTARLPSSEAVDCKLPSNKDVPECKRLRAIEQDKLLK